MASRMRSWISRSSSSAAPPPTTPRTARSPGGPGRAALGSATIPPGDHDTEREVQPAEPHRHQRVAPTRRREQRHGAKRHEAQAHERHDAHGMRAAGDDPRPVEQKPGTGERWDLTDTDQRDGEKDTYQQRRDM